jgi:hypothetical protein
MLSRMSRYVIQTASFAGLNLYLGQMAAPSSIPEGQRLGEAAH